MINGRNCRRLPTDGRGCTSSRASRPGGSGTLFPFRRNDNTRVPCGSRPIVLDTCKRHCPRPDRTSCWRHRGVCKASSWRRIADQRPDRHHGQYSRQAPRRPTGRPLHGILAIARTRLVVAGRARELTRNANENHVRNEQTHKSPAQPTPLTRLRSE